MIQNSSVFILGAGASKPYGFPTGDELRRLLCALPDEDPVNVMPILKDCGYLENGIRRLAQALAASGLPSVDTFLARRTDHERECKAAMAAILLSKEDSGTLHAAAGVRGNLDWYGELWRRMMDGVRTVEDLVGRNNVRFITFNYDRSLEKFLHEAIKNTFSVDDHVAHNAWTQFGITHVYGSLGRFDPQATLTYGWPEDELDRPQALLRAINAIRVIPEDRQQFVELPPALFGEWARRVFILGFSFDSVNCEQLGLADAVATRMRQMGGTLRPKVFATVLGLTDRQRVRAMRNLLQEHSDPPSGLEVVGRKCLEALHFWDALD